MSTHLTDPNEAADQETRFPQVYFDDHYGVAICTRCGTGISPNGEHAASNHFRYAPHRLKGPEFAAVKSRLKTLPLKRIDEIPYPAHLQQPVPAVPYLKCLKGWYCDHCPDWHSTSQDKSSAHLSKKHGVRAGKEEQGIQPCLLQTFFRNKRDVHYFRVLGDVGDAERGAQGQSDPPERQQRNGSERFLSMQKDSLGQIQKEEERQAGIVSGFDEHKSAVIPWVQTCGFDRHTKGLDKTEMRSSWRLPGSDGGNVEKMDDGDRRMQKVAHAAERMLEEAWSWCVDGPGCRLTRPMAVRLSQFWIEATVHSKGFRPGIQKATRANYFRRWGDLLVYVWRVQNSRAFRKGPTTVNEAESGAQLPAQGLPLKCTQQQQTTLELCLRAAADEDDAKLIDSIRALSIALIQHRLTGDRFQSPVLSFCAMQAIERSTSGWKTAGSFNGILSGLVYCAQLCIFRQACHVVDHGSTSASIEIDDVLADLCQRWLHPQQSTTFGIILNWRMLLFHVSKRDVSGAAATWSLDRTEVCYLGTAISMNQITQLYHHTLAAARIIMNRDLMLGAEHIIRLSTGDLADAGHRQDIDWWFGRDERNAHLLHDCDQQLLQHILTTPALHEGFVTSDDQWDPQALALYEHNVQLFLDHLFVLVQISAPPLRGPEVLSLTWRNTERPRNMYIKHGRVMLYTTYHKGQAQWGAYKDNVRFLPNEVSDLVVNFLAFSQRLRRLFLWSQKPGELQSSFLWHRNDTVWDEKRLTPTLRRACAAAEVPELSVSHWRQICSSIVKVKFADTRSAFKLAMGLVKGKGRRFVSNGSGSEGDTSDSDGEDADVTTLITMSNHSVRTHNIAYSNQTGLAFANARDELINKAYHASESWSVFFRFRGTNNIPPSDHGIRNRCRPHLEDVTEELATLKRIKADGRPAEKRIWSGPALLREARRLYADRDLKWRCAAQEEAMCAVMSEAREVLVVLATGSGKTLLYQLPCMLPGARTTVVIIPLVALRMDLHRRCRKLNIDCQSWSADQQTHASLVLMSVEAAVSPTGRQFLHALHYEKRLDRIVIDECHLTETASGYRPLMTRLALLRSIPAQFVYLTATLPPTMQEAFLRRHFLTQVTEIRAPTRRSNIRYTVSRLSRNSNGFYNAAADWIRGRWVSLYKGVWASSRAVIFTQTKSNAEKLAALLRCDYFHADAGSPDDKIAMLTRWIDGESSPFLVGTSGLGTGLDYPHVRLSVHVDEPHGMVDFVQESGRAGRDGIACESMIILKHNWRPMTERIVDPDKGAVYRLLTCVGCYRAPIDEYMDASSLDICSPSDERCGHCSKQTKLTGMAHRPTSRSPRDRDTIDRVVQSQVEVANTADVAMKVHMRQQAHDMMLYRKRLDIFKDGCILCWLAGYKGWVHTFSECKDKHKWMYFKAKREVIQKSKFGWIKKHTACFYCYQPPSICGRGTDPTIKVCEYGDLVMQSVFGAFLYESSRRWLQNRFKVEFSQAGDCLKWAGTPADMCGDKAVLAVHVLAYVLEQVQGLELEPN